MFRIANCGELLVVDRSVSARSTRNRRRLGENVLFPSAQFGHHGDDVAPLDTLLEPSSDSVSRAS